MTNSNLPDSRHSTKGEAMKETDLEASQRSLDTSVDRIKGHLDSALRSNALVATSLQAMHDSADRMAEVNRLLRRIRVQLSPRPLVEVFLEVSPTAYEVSGDAIIH